MPQENDSIYRTDGPEVSQPEAAAELERLIADNDFQCSDRNRRFLRFVAEETFAGRSDLIKAYSIAVDVFGRPPDFDGSTDPIVRIEATRLRAALARYYERRPPGSIGIALPSGRYVPIFYREKRDHEATTDDGELLEPALESADGEPPQMPSMPPNSNRHRWATALAVITCGILGSVLLYAVSWSWTAPRRFSEKPTVVVRIEPENAGLTDESSRLGDFIIATLSRFQTLRLIQSDHTQAIGLERRDPDFSVEIKYSGRSNARLIRWRVIDTEDAEVIASGEEDPIDVEHLARSSELERVLARLSSRLASGSGVITSRMLAKELQKPTLGYGCILRAFRSLQTEEAATEADARACLEQTIASRASYADAKGLLALLLIRNIPYDEPSPELDHALSLVRDAAAVAPDSSTVAFARMTLEFLCGRADLALIAGRSALQMNPQDDAIAARLGGILYVTGNQDEGLTLARRAGAYSRSIYPDAELILALDDYMRQEYLGALKHIEGAGSGSSYGAMLLRTAIRGQMGLSLDRDAGMDGMTAAGARFERTFEPMMKRLAVAPHLAAALADGLRKAGLNVGSEASQANMVAPDR